MKKLIFLFTFAFIGGQAFSQIYLVTIANAGINSCTNAELTLTKVPPSGPQIHTCISSTISGGGLEQLNQELNSIVSQGYKLIETSYGNSGSSQGLIEEWYLNQGTTFIFAIPWSANGLEEVATTLKSFILSPNPANTFVDISLDYSLKGESEVVFISEAGYISHKESIGNISKNEKYNIDISKIPAGKYLVTIVNGKTYTTPQKLIVF